MEPSASWTDERVERLRALVADGHSASEIADALGGVSRNGVCGKAHRLGLSFGGGAGQVLQTLAPSPRMAPVKRIAAAAKPARTSLPAVPVKPQRAAVAPDEPAVEPTPKAWPKPAGPEAVDLDGLRTRHCRMPLWGGAEKSGLYCGRPVRAEGESWCLACAGLVYERRPIRAQEEARSAQGRILRQASRSGAFAS